VRIYCPGCYAPIEFKPHDLEMTLIGRDGKRDDSRVAMFIESHDMPVDALPPNKLTVEVVCPWSGALVKVPL
jgi:hypothetical protein